MGGSVVLIVLNLILFAMLVLGWQLWRQSVPKKRKINTAEVADWPSGATTVDNTPQGVVAAGSVAHDPHAHGVAAPQDASAPVPQLVGASNSAGNFSETTSAADTASFAAPGATVAPAMPAQTMPAPTMPAPPAAPVEAPVSEFAAPMQSGVVDDAELAALLDSAPPTAVAPVPATVHAPAAPVASDPVASAPLFSSPAPVSSLAPPVLTAPVQPVATDTAMGDDVSRQVSALLATPSAPAQPVVASPPAPASAHAPVSSLPPIAPSVGSSDRLRLDITGRPVDDVMRSLATRLGEMGYDATSGPSGETVFQRGTSESIRIAVSAQETSSTDAAGRPLPGRADVEVVGGQLQETTEAVLFELLDHGFQLRWAVAGELVLSSFDGALARVNVNPTVSA